MINSDHDNNNNVSTEYGDGCGRIGLDVNSNAAPFQQQPQQETAHLRPSFFAPWQSEYGGAMNHSPFSNWVFRVIDNNCKKIWRMDNIFQYKHNTDNSSPSLPKFC